MYVLCLLALVSDLLVENKHQAAIAKCDQVFADFQHRITTVPPSELVQLWSFKADALVKLEQFDTALVTYRQALELDPNNSLLLLQVADMLFELKRFGEVVDVTSKIIALNPEDPEGHALKASALVQVATTTGAKPLL